jgi:hypothetical protein
MDNGQTTIDSSVDPFTLESGLVLYLWLVLLAAAFLICQTYTLSLMKVATPFSERLVHFTEKHENLKVLLFIDTSARTSNPTHNPVNF